MSKAVVCVVDDNSSVRRFVCTVLERFGCTILTAKDGPGALELIRGFRDHIDMLFTDVEMPPGMDGVSLCRIVQTERPRTALLVASTGYVKDLPHNSVFLNKPFTRKDLLHKAQEALASSALTVI